MTSMMMRILRFLPILSAISLCGATPMGVAQNWQVSIKNAFLPQTLNISVRDSVTWRNTDTSDHNVTAINKTFTSGVLKPGQTFTWTFTASGIVQYECTIQPRLTGTIKVQ
jgi:plastocyanin